MSLSEYQYITVAELKTHMIKDYSSITDLTDDVYAAQITAAEQAINGYIGTSLTGTDITDAAKICAKTIAHMYVENYLIREGLGGEYEVQKSIYDNMDMIMLLEKLKETHNPKFATSVHKKEIYPKYTDDFGRRRGL